MKSDFKIIKINNHKIEYKEKNNSKKNTLLFLHGMNSSLEFALPIYEKIKNFNVIAINFPINKNNKYNIENITIDEMILITKKIIKKIKTNVYVLGHSLSGAILAKLNKNVKKFFYLSTINPNLIYQMNYIESKKIIFGNTKKEKIKKAIIEKVFAKVISKNQSDFIKAFLNDNSGYKEIIINNLFNETYMKDELKKGYINNSKKSIYIIGDRDTIVKSQNFTNFIKSIGNDVILIKNAGHNPIKDASEIVLEILNQNIPNKKYFFKRNIKII
ncbi:MAG: alpha/beta hydrolase [Mycoplasmatales bacterium]|nr:alpha/beta hydrolase [Mycoplasmatales bacterium]